MIEVAPSLPPAPEGQQGPPTRAALPALRARRVARGSLPLTSGTGSPRANQRETGECQRRDAEITHNLDTNREH